MDQECIFVTKDSFDLTRIKSTFEDSNIIFTVKNKNIADVIDGGFKTSDLPSIGDEYEVYVPSDQANHARALIDQTVQGVDLSASKGELDEELTSAHQQESEKPLESMEDTADGSLIAFFNAEKTQVYKLVFLTLSSFFILPAFFSIPYFSRTKLIKPWGKALLGIIIFINAVGSLLLFIFLPESRIVIIGIGVPLYVVISSLKSFGLFSRGEKAGAFLLLIPILIGLVLTLFTNLWIDLGNLLF